MDRKYKVDIDSDKQNDKENNSEDDDKSDQLKTLLVNFFFVYESPDMKRLHCRYGDNLILLDVS